MFGGIQVIFPNEKIISVYLPNQEKAEYKLLKHFEEGEKVKVNVLEDLVIDLDDIFDYKPILNNKKAFKSDSKGFFIV